MPYVFEKIVVNEPICAFLFLHKTLGYSIAKSQRLIDKGYLRQNEKIIKKSEILCGEYEFLTYKCKQKGLKIIYENDEFAAVFKPSGVLSHPNGRYCKYSLCDEIWAKWGKKSSIAHRLDYETSGVLLVGKNEKTTKDLKSIFAAKNVQKEYLAIVKSGILQRFGDEFLVDKPLGLTKNKNDFKNKMVVRLDGKNSLTKFKVLKQNEHFSLLLAKPITGRQHQIRAHLNHIGFSILGDSIYGVSADFTRDFLDGKIDVRTREKITGARRLCLHASKISIEIYGKNYCFESSCDFEKYFE